MLQSRQIAAVCMAIGLLFSAACGGEDEAEQPVAEQIPGLPELAYTDGHLTAEQRGLPLDEFDLQVLPGMRTHTPAEISALFDVVVINAPFVKWPAACAPQNDGTSVQPAAKVRQQLDAIRAAGVTSPTVAVNVDIMTPGRTNLYHVCFTEGANRPRFDVSEYQRQLKTAFSELAELDAVKYITIGIDMNVYYHATIDDSRQIDDYTNFILTYRDLFADLKEKRPDLKIGPGINYTYFRRLSMPEVATEYGFEQPAADASVNAKRAFDNTAAYYADKRLVEPLLANGRGGARQITADFLGLSFFPFPNTDPFNGEPEPSDDGARQAILDWYRPLHSLVTTNDSMAEIQLPIVVVQADWPEGEIKRPKKAAFLNVLKTALSPFTVEWFAWRRFSDLPDPEVGSPCAQFTRASDPSLSFPAEYCGSGIVDQYGTVEDENSVFRTLTIDP
ncbi:MAG: hypothetical protein CMH52_01760 [Myxococcales bacterium]|nr:hypothetical protein [Myxococcales bacterium]